MNEEKNLNQEAGQEEPKDPTNQGEGNEEGKEKNYSQAELDTEISKAVDSALGRASKKNQKAIDDAVAKAVAAAEAKAKLSAEELAAQELADREKAIADKEAELTRKEFLADVKSTLSSRGMPMVLAELIVNSTSSEESEQLIGAVQTAWDAALKEQSKAKARQADPADSQSLPSNNATVDLADFAKENRKI